jgi:hypothetical protein
MKTKRLTIKRNAANGKRLDEFKCCPKNYSASSGKNISHSRLLIKTFSVYACRGQELASNSTVFIISHPF